MTKLDTKSLKAVKGGMCGGFTPPPPSCPPPSCGGGHGGGGYGGGCGWKKSC